ncbi:hypothetical protein SLE2022_060210 [Rubroshorea leprosula]
MAFFSITKPLFSEALRFQLWSLLWVKLLETRNLLPTLQRFQREGLSLGFQSKLKNSTATKSTLEPEAGNSMTLLTANQKKTRGKKRIGSRSKIQTPKETAKNYNLAKDPSRCSQSVEVNAELSLKVN